MESQERLCTGGTIRMGLSMGSYGISRKDRQKIIGKIAKTNKQNKETETKNSECHLTSVTVQRELLSNGNSFLVNMDPT